MSGPVQTTILAASSHELRTRLTGLLGLADVLLLTPLDAQQRRFANLIRGSTDSLVSMLTSILDLSSIEAGGLVLQRVPFDPREATDHAVHSHTPAAAAKGLELEWTADPDVPRSLAGDAARIRQLLGHLLSNAIHNTEHGSVAVRLGVDRTSPADGIDLRWTVRDTGCGIPPDRLSRLLRPGAVVRQPAPSKAGGGGLGLELVSRMTALMGGGFGAESSVGVGSVFWFTARLGPAGSNAAEPPRVGKDGAGPAEKRPPAAAERDAGRGARILIAEDNEVNQVVAREVLNRAGHACDIADDGNKALTAILSGQYDLVLMDCRMPIIDGFAATRAIRQAEARGEFVSRTGRRIPIIALTAGTDWVDRERCLTAGMDGYTAKPIDPAKLLEMIGTFVPA